LLLAGLWWGLFTIPAVVWLRDRGVATERKQSFTSAARGAVREVVQTLRNVRKYQMLTIFLIGFLFYNDGVQTVISQASVFAGKALDMGADELVMLVLMIQFVAAIGALVVGKISDRFGAKNALHFCLAIWVGLLVFAYFVESRTHFWIMGVVVALVMGGTQSVSRTIMGLMTPPARTAEFFGFFNLSGKAISMFGPIVFSTTLALTGSPHRAILSLLAFFIIGWLFISRLNIATGRAQAAMAEQ
jgi:UMF1 family MFS transporter